MAQTTTKIVDLAKELHVKPADVVKALSELGIYLRNYQGVSLDGATASRVRKVILKEGPQAAAEAAPAAPQKAPAPQKPTTAPQPEAAEKRPAALKPTAAHRRPATHRRQAPAPAVAEAPTPAPAPTRKKEAPAPKAVEKVEAAPQVKAIEMGDSITVRELAEKLGTESADVITRLVSMGHLVTMNQPLARDIAAKVAEHYGFEVHAAKATPAAAPATPRQTVVKRRMVTRPLQPRPPVVTILGHVDHGKTTLLDAIRKTNVVAHEFGGITQHIGAYQTEIRTQDGTKRITFIDTPGHAAFTQMRARGAQCTDIVILVVAADDGVMPQTIEAINHARAAKVPIIVAINKVDKEDANVERTKQQLMEQGLVPEEWGGDTIITEISAKEKMGIDDVLEMIVLVAEMQELKADPAGTVAGTVVEAQLEKGRGPVATILVQDGTLKRGDIIVANTAWGRIKAMLDDRGNRVSKAGPSMPIEVQGLNAMPMAGDHIEVVKDEKEAREITEMRLQQQRDASAVEVKPRVTLQDLFKQMETGEVKEFNLILKADVQGTLEVLRDSLNKVSAEETEVNVEVLHAGVGSIGESDIMLASASNAVVIGFNTRLDPKARKSAEEEGIDVRLYNVIYELIDDVRAAMKGMLAPVYTERVLGMAEVRAIFHSPRGAIAGCMVTDGRVQRGSEARVLRGGAEVFKGKLSSLRHIKEDVREMAAGFECGIMLDGFNEYAEGDIVQSFVTEEAHRA